MDYLCFQATPFVKQLRNQVNRRKQFSLKVDNIMIDNKQNNKTPNTHLEPILPLQQQNTPKANSQKPHFYSHQAKFQDDLYQQPPKVLRNSSSQYDSVLQKFYKKQQQNDVKSTFKQGKNQRETKQQISFIIDRSQKEVTAAYFIATKQSNSGVFSHQRFFVVDIMAKQIKYYTNTPRLPLKSTQEIVEKPKQCIRFNQPKKISVSHLKKGIGQLQIRWTQNSQTKEWKLKLGNNVMAKQLTILIDSIKTGKPVIVEGRKKSKEKIMKELNSSRNQNNSLNKSSISRQKKESVVVSKGGPSNLSNLLLNSMLNPNENKVEKMKEVVRKQKVKIEVSKIIEKIDQDMPVLKDSPKNAKIEKSLKIESFIVNQNILKAVEQESQDQIKEKVKNDNIQARENNEIKQKEYKQKQTIQIKNQQTQDSREKNLQMFKSQNKNASPQQQNSIQENKCIEIKPETKLSSMKSIRFQEIIKNAAIQYQYHQKQLHHPQIIPISIINIGKPRKSQLETVIQRRKEIEEQSTPTQRTINNKQQLQMSKVIVKNIFKNTTESKTLELSRKKSLNDQKLNHSRQNQEINYYQSTAPPKKQSLRQNLLQERKYAQSLQVTDKREAKIMNTHSHPRKQRSRSNSASSKIEHYIQKQKQQKHQHKDWFLKWVTTQNSNQRGILYKKIVDEFTQKVQALSKKFNSWHLFHKEGEYYIAKEGQIEMLYVVLTRKDGQGGCQNIEMQYAHKFNQLSYLWNMTEAGRQLNNQYKMVIAPTCIVNYKGLRVFCKLDISQAKLKFRDVSYLRQYEQLMTQISRKCHSKVKSIQLYELILGNKKHLYVESIQVRPSIQKPLTYLLNQVYVNSYVAGVITLQSHLQKIHNHYQTFIVPSLATLLQTFTPLSYLQLQYEMTKLGIDRSVLPMLYMYCRQNQKKRQNKFIISELCSQIISQNIRRDIHDILLSKVPDKNIDEQIYSLLMKNLRMDNPDVSQSLQLRYHLKISFQQLRDNIVEQFLITSLLIKLGIKCNLKEHKFEVKQLQKTTELFWQQFQFSQQTVSFKWQNKTTNYSSLPLHEQSSYFEHLFFPKKTIQPQNEFVYDRKHLLEKLDASQNKSYHESWVFLLLNEYQQELIKSLIAKEQLNLPIVEWQYQRNPFYHLKHNPLLYYYTYNSFQSVIFGLRNLIQKGQYQNAHNLLEVQLVRAWVWGSKNPTLLVTILQLKSELNQLMCNQIESIESILQGLRISIKYYELSAFKLQDVIHLCKNTAQLHVRYHKYRKAIQFYQTCIALFQKAVEQNQTIPQIFNNNINIYTQRVKAYLKLGDYLKVQESAKLNMITFFRWKEQLQHQQPDVLTIIYSQQFQSYSLLFRAYQIRGKYIDLVQLMQDCSIKYVENYLQLVIQYDTKVSLDQQQIHQYSQVLKNMWIAVIANTNHDKIPSYQQYFNYYYSPLRNLKLEVVKDILLKIRKMHKGLTPYQKQQSLNQLMCLLVIKIKQNKQKQQSMDKGAKSILMLAIIECLSLLSISQKTFLQTKGPCDLSQVIMLQQIVSILGFQFTIGVIESYLQDYKLQL